jgi:transposase-like protein
MSADETTGKRRDYDAATKSACLAALLAGQGTTEVAKAYKVPEGTVKSWRARMKDATGASTFASVASEKREQIGELLIDYLHANLSTLRAQLIVFGDPAWLKLQNAADVAVLHGVMTDKSIRLLEALGGSPDPVPSDAGADH